MKYKIINKGSPIDYEGEINSLTNFAKDRFGFKRPPSFILQDDPANGSKLLGKTGYYDPNSMQIHIFTTGRHPKDILRSIAHELVHHMQHDNGDLNQGGYTGQGYAQKNPHLRDMERQAYEMGNLCFRDWEDGLKQEQPTIYNERRNRKMSVKDWKNKELGKNLTEKWGFKMDLSKLNENIQEESGGSVLNDCVKRAVKKGMKESEAKSKCQKAINDFKEREGREPEEMHLGSTPGESEEFSDLLETKGEKPDFLDLDGDGDKEEPMKKAAKDAEK